MSNIVINGKTYNGVESITVKDTSGNDVKYSEGECDLIDVAEPPTENVDDGKVYRIKKEISEMYLVSDGIIGSLSVDWGSQLAEYSETLVDSIDNVAEPKTTNLDGGALNIYIDKNTGIGYVWSENPETSEIVRMTLGELFTLMGMPIQDMGKTEDFASITQDGLYFVNVKTAIAIPNAENDKLIFSYDGHEWNKLHSLTECERPAGTIEITENGTHDVTNYASANVNVPVPECDLIDVNELPTENVDESKVYRVQGGEYYVSVTDDVSGRATYSLEQFLSNVGLIVPVNQILIDNIDNVTDPVLSTVGGFVVYTVTDTYNGYLFGDFAGTGEVSRMDIAELVNDFLPDGELTYKRKINDVSEITEDGIFYISIANKTIGLPNAEKNRKIYEYNGTEWVDPTFDISGLYGVWYYVNDENNLKRFYEINPNGTIIVKNLMDGVMTSNTYEYTLQGNILVYEEGIDSHFISYVDGVTATLSIFGYIQQPLTKQLSLNLQTLEVSQNGTYSLPYNSEIDGYSQVAVSVPNKLQQLMNKTITTVTAEDLEGATEIKDFAFMDCSDLATIEMPSSVTNIGKLAFYNCVNLTDITIGDGVTSIEGGAFGNCVSLKTIRLNSSNPPQLTLDTTIGVEEPSKINTIPSTIEKIEVPTDSLGIYQTGTNWSLFSDIMIGV